MTYCVTPPQLFAGSRADDRPAGAKLTELGLFYESYLVSAKRALRPCDADRAAGGKLRAGGRLRRQALLSGGLFPILRGVQLRILDAILPQAEETACIFYGRLRFREVCLGRRRPRRFRAWRLRRNVEVSRSKRQREKRRGPRRSLSGWLTQCWSRAALADGRLMEAVTLIHGGFSAHACELAAGDPEAGQAMAHGGVRSRSLYGRALRRGIEAHAAKGRDRRVFCGTVDILQKPLLQAVLSATQAAKPVFV